jgi:hypothetical protein
VATKFAESGAHIAIVARGREALNRATTTIGATANARIINVLNIGFCISRSYGLPFPASSRISLTVPATMIGLLCQPEGTTIAAIMQATGRQQHSVLGLTLTSEKAEDGERVYRIVDGPTGKSKAESTKRQPN